MDKEEIAQVFRFFTEAGIIMQLAGTMIEKHLPDRLTNVHFGLLGHLSRRPEGSTPQQLAYAFQIPKTSMTHMIRVMEDMNLIEIAPNPNDARSKLARITPAGLAQLQQTVAAAAQEVQSMEPAFNTRAAIACLPHLKEIREQLDADRDRQPRSDKA